MLLGKGGGGVGRERAEGKGRGRGRRANGAIVTERSPSESPFPLLLCSLSLSLSLFLSLSTPAPLHFLTWLIAPVHAVAVVVVDPRRREGLPGAVEAPERRRRRFQCRRVEPGPRRPHAPGERRRSCCRRRRGDLDQRMQHQQARKDREGRAERARARPPAAPSSHCFGFCSRARGEKRK